MNVRMDIPQYIHEQVKEVCHRGRHTMPYLFLKLLSEAKDERDSIFFVRDEDSSLKIAGTPNANFSPRPEGRGFLLR